LTVPADLNLPSNLEVAPRDAKGWLRQTLKGYNPVRDQDVLTQAIPLESLQSTGLRSFRRLESAVQQLVRAVTSGTHIATP
jgi:hypothetical protein